MNWHRAWRPLLWIGAAIAGLAVVALFGIWACISFSAKEGIIEAAVRLETKGCSAGETVFLRIVDVDPSPEFLSRFGDVSWKAKPVSKAKFRDPGHGVFDPETGRDAEIITIGEITFESTFKAIVWYSVYDASLGGAKYRCVVSWQKGRWVVTERGLFSIS